MERWPETPTLPVAWGEVFDKLTILRIKYAKFTDPVKRANVSHECKAIETVIGDPRRFPQELTGLIEELKEINAKLWLIEDAKRDCERQQKFDAQFIELARNVYIWNDRRAEVKRQINQLLGSAIVEEKQYQSYQVKT